MDRKSEKGVSSAGSRMTSSHTCKGCLIVHDRHRVSKICNHITLLSTIVEGGTTRCHRGSKAQLTTGGGGHFQLVPSWKQLDAIFIPRPNLPQREGLFASSCAIFGLNSRPGGHPTTRPKLLGGGGAAGTMGMGGEGAEQNWCMYQVK